jgi:hypothetical protein
LGEEGMIKDPRTRDISFERGGATGYWRSLKPAFEDMVIQSLDVAQRGKMNEHQGEGFVDGTALLLSYLAADKMADT